MNDSVKSLEKSLKPNNYCNVWTIAMRDFRSNFTSPIAYVVLAAFLGVMGWMFFNILIHYFNYLNQSRHMMGMNGKMHGMTDGVLMPLFSNMNVILLFLLPFVTMRLLAEEQRNSTLVLLMTSPVRTSQIVMGKFLSAVLLLMVMFGLTIVYPVVLFLTTNVQVGPVVSAYIGLLLNGASYLAIGLFFSSVTQYQIVAGLLTFGGLLFFWLIGWAGQNASAPISDIIEYVSITTHFQDFARGIVNSADVVYYLSFIGIFLFLATKVLDSYRWR